MAEQFEEVGHQLLDPLEHAARDDDGQARSFLQVARRELLAVLDAVDERGERMRETERRREARARPVAAAEVARRLVEVGQGRRVVLLEVVEHLLAIAAQQRVRQLRKHAPQQREVELAAVLHLVEQQVVGLDGGARRDAAVLRGVDELEERAVVRAEAVDVRREGVEGEGARVHQAELLDALVHLEGERRVVRDDDDALGAQPFADVEEEGRFARAGDGLDHHVGARIAEEVDGGALLGRGGWQHPTGGGEPPPA